MRVIETNPHTDHRWASFVAAHPNATIYHHQAWLRALEMEHGQPGVHLACEDAEGHFLAILPMLYTRGLPFNLGGFLASRRLSSLPRTPLAGPLSTDLEATAAILEAAVSQVRQNPGIKLQIKTCSPDLDGLIEGLDCVPWRNSYVLRLPVGSDSPFCIVDHRHRYAVKKAVAKATRLGVRVRAAETETELRDWYMLYLDTLRRNAFLARPYRFFAGLWEALRPQGMMRLLVAEQETAGRKRILAGSIFLMLGRTVSHAFTGSRRDDLSARPNDILLWTAINDAHRGGFQFVDFGEVPEERPDLARFKAKWGAEPTRLYRYYYPVLSEERADGNKARAFAMALARAAWRRLPSKATAWLGDRFYGYL